MAAMQAAIRFEAPGDEAAIDAVTQAAFLEAHHTSHTEHLIVAALRKAGALSISLVADFQNRVVGHVAFSPVSITDGSLGWFGLGPVSVVPEYQRSGIGKALIQNGLRLLRERGAAGCVVLGDPHYYSRFGFKVEPDLILPGVPLSYFQVLCLEPPRAHGSVAYHEAFSL